MSVAERAGAPVTPKPARNLIIALVMGVLSGAGVAYVRETLDDSVRNKDELARVTGLPVLGVIPAIPEWAKTNQKLAVGETGFVASEAFRRLRTSVQLLGVDRPVETLQFTSPNPGEGKTSLILALGVVLAQAGQRVVIVDCDLRRPQLHRVSGLTNDEGFTTVFHNKVPVCEAVRPVTDAYPLYALTSGPLPANPSELLGAKRTAEVIFELQGDFDIVLVDSPPVLPVTDATLLAGWVEATLVVAKARSTTRKQLTEAVDQLKIVDAKLLGSILNHASPDLAYGYSYQYH